MVTALISLQVTFLRVCKKSQVYNLKRTSVIIHPSVCPSVCLSVCQFVSLSACLFTSCADHYFIPTCLICLIFHTDVVNDPTVYYDLEPMSYLQRQGHSAHIPKIRDLTITPLDSLDLDNIPYNCCPDARVCHDVGPRSYLQGQGHRVLDITPHWLVGSG